MQPLKMLTIFIYCVLPFFQRPAWCLIADAQGKIGTGSNYYNCQISQWDKIHYHASTEVPVSNMPFLPPLFTNITFILCEIILAGFIEAQKRLIRETKEQQRAETITYILCIISICDYIKATIAVSLQS